MKKEDTALQSRKIKLEAPVVKSKPVYDITKRLFDIVCSLLALIVLSPILIACAVKIKKEDGGPAIFVQERLGKNGKPFRMYKFRTMCMGAEDMLADLMDQNELDGPAFKMKEDPRITKFGVKLRKNSLDELPQLINILNGTMSIVGPRPPLPNEVAQYNEYQRHRLDVVPGLTCYWQCSGRNNITFDQWMEMDMQYIRERSMITDIKLIIKTIIPVLKGIGAW